MALDSLDDLEAAARERRAAAAASEPVVRQLHSDLAELYRRRGEGTPRRRVVLFAHTPRRHRLAIAFGRSARGAPKGHRR